MALGDVFKTMTRKRALPTPAVLLAGVFLLDLAAPAGTAVWAFYLIPLLLTIRSADRRAPVWTAAAISGLVLLAPAFTAPGASPATTGFNRLIGLLVVWAAALLLRKSARGGADELGEEGRSVEAGAEAESEACHRALAESNLVGLFGFELGGRITSANDTFLKLLGYDRADLAEGRLRWDELTPAEFRPLDAMILDELTSHGTAKPVEKALIRKDGSRLPVLVGAARLRGVEGRAVGFILDVTDRHQAEEDLRRHQREQRIIFDSVPAMIWYKDAENRILRANEPAAQSVGLSVKELEGKSADELYPEEAAKYHEDDLEVIRTGKPKLGIVEPYQGTDGEKRWLRTDRLPFRDERGQVAGVIVFAVDITDRIRVEEALTQAQARLDQRVEERGRELAQAQEELTTEATIRSQVEAELEASQEQVRQLHRLEAIGRLAGGIGHEFNNLLTVILGQARLFQEALDPATGSYRRMEELVQAARRAAGLAQQLLAFSRKQPHRPVPLDLNGLIAAQAPTLRALVGDRVTLVLDLAPAPMTVMADATQLEQVLINLCLNAGEAMPDGGTLTIRTSAVELAAPAVERHLRLNPGACVLLEVADEGVGMDDFVKTHCLEPFFTTKTNGRASGLGLSTVYGIVTRHEGRIAVDSEPGRGTVVKVHLPRAAETPEERRRVQAARELPQGTETVLLVEDDQPVRGLLWQVFTAQGYTVIGAASAKEALEAAERHGAPLHLLVTDLVMSGMGGLELARVLRAAHPALRVLYISGTTDVPTLQAMGLPMDADFLPKPFEPEELLRTVREVLEAPPRTAICSVCGGGPLDVVSASKAAGRRLCPACFARLVERDSAEPTDR